MMDLVGEVDTIPTLPPEHCRVTGPDHVRPRPVMHEQRVRTGPRTDLDGEVRADRRPPFRDRRGQPSGAVVDLGSSAVLYPLSADGEGLSDVAVLRVEEVSDSPLVPLDRRAHERSTSMVAFTHGKYDKKRTRLFKIRDIPKGDDYAALRQVILRRLIRAKEENDLPDLIVVDGGKGQLTQALDVLKELDIVTVDPISVAKQEGKHDKGMTQEKIFLPGKSDPVLLPLHSPLLFLLQRIRDEAHRKAIGFHRQSRTKRTITSLIDEIPGIGDVKRQRLLSHFGSLQRILEASEDALMEVKGINSRDVAQIKKFANSR